MWPTRVFLCSCPRAGWNSEEDDKKGKGCMLQFQHAMVRVLTHFMAEQEDPRDPKVYFLGSDWQVDVTKLVRYFMKVEDTRVARLQAGRVLSGRDLGTTSIQVLNWNKVKVGLGSLWPTPQQEVNGPLSFCLIKEYRKVGFKFYSAQQWSTQIVPVQRTDEKSGEVLYSAKHLWSFIVKQCCQSPSTQLI